MSSTSTNSRTAKKQKELDYSEKLKLMDEEFMSFHQYCQQMGFTSEEMEVICAPLLHTVRKNLFKKVLRISIFLVILGLLIYALSSVGIIALHFTAIGRIFMIKALAVWDWRPLFFENCIMNNPFYGEYTITEEDCVACEALDKIDRLDKVNYEFLMSNYLDHDAPFIITDAMDSWPVMNTDNFYFENITQLYLKDEKLTETVPCILTTNLRTGSSDLVVFLKRIQNSNLNKWFVHWQNCDINAVKALRKLYQRPYFLPNTISPAHFNWVLMASDYNANNFKKVELDSGLITLSQLRGKTVFKLIPHNPCNMSCPELRGSLQEGEMLVFTNFLWTFEYHPGHQMDNVAILTETVWDENLV
uniref:Cupin-like domain-containing protein n=1 Tax=Clastoptera arizonana TaxID=38151 RepID=A0A1B6CL03_9HEMI